MRWSKSQLDWEIQNDYWILLDCPLSDVFEV
jgi:putative AlgH/UPF0301 family transcriptional regulator